MMVMQTEWTAEHTESFDWIGTLGLAGAGLALAIFLWLLVRGLSRSARYRATTSLGTSEREALAAEITEAEHRTTGEIAVVVLERSDRHPGAEWRASMLILVFGSILFTGWLPWGQPLAFFACQLALGLLGFLAASKVPGFKRAFISEARAEEVAQEQAVQEFFGNGLHRTEEGTGVLLFVSLLEHRVIVLGDRGIDEKLDASHWVATDEAILEGIRAGSLKEGLVQGIRRTADVLAEHFPGDHGNEDEVSNHVIVRAE